MKKNSDVACALAKSFAWVGPSCLLILGSLAWNSVVEIQKYE